MTDISKRTFVPETKTKTGSQMKKKSVDELSDEFDEYEKRSPDKRNVQLGEGNCRHADGQTSRPGMEEVSKTPSRTWRSRTIS